MRCVGSSGAFFQMSDRWPGCIKVYLRCMLLYKFFSQSFITCSLPWCWPRQRSSVLVPVCHLSQGNGRPRVTRQAWNGRAHALWSRIQRARSARDGLRPPWRRARQQLARTLLLKTGTPAPEAPSLRRAWTCQLPKCHPTCPTALHLQTSPPQNRQSWRGRTSHGSKFCSRTSRTRCR